MNDEAAGDAHVWQRTILTIRRKPPILMANVLSSKNSHPTGRPSTTTTASVITMNRAHLLPVLLAPVATFAQSPLDNCAEQFIAGTVDNAPTILGSPSAEPFGNNQHLCYRDDGVSFFAIEYWPDHFAPRWAAYKLDPENYGPDGCGTFTRAKANCYVRSPTFQEFLDCDQNSHRSDFFYRDLILGGATLDDDAFEVSSHDRGHIAPRQAFSWHVCGTHQTFTMANMSPQRAFLNQDIWQHLEQQVLTWAFDEGPIFVVTGTTFRSFPHARFEAFTDGILDSDQIYSSDATFIEAVEQTLLNNTDHPDGHILRSKRTTVRPDDLDADARNVRVPTGYFKVIFLPSSGNEPAHAIGFLLPHTFENLNMLEDLVPGMQPEKAFWSFVSRIDVIERAAGMTFPGIPDAMKSEWGDQFFFDRDDARDIRGASCGVGDPQGVLIDSTVEERRAACRDLLTVN